MARKGAECRQGRGLTLAAGTVHRNRRNGAAGGIGARLARMKLSKSHEPLCHRACGEALGGGHPELAARLWRAQGMRIVDAKKSKYYDAALSNFERARNCYLRAGPGGRVGEDRAPGVRFALPQDRIHQWISGVGCRRETQGSAFLSGARQGALGRAARGKRSIGQRFENEVWPPRHPAANRSSNPTRSSDVEMWNLVDSFRLLTDPFNMAPRRSRSAELTRNGRFSPCSCYEFQYS